MHHAKARQIPVSFVTLKEEKRATVHNIDRSYVLVPI